MNTKCSRKSSRATCIIIIYCSFKAFLFICHTEWKNEKEQPETNFKRECWKKCKNTEVSDILFDMLEAHIFLFDGRQVHALIRIQSNWSDWIARTYTHYRLFSQCCIHCTLCALATTHKHTHTNKNNPIHTHRHQNGICVIVVVVVSLTRENIDFLSVVNSCFMWIFRVSADEIYTGWTLRFRLNIKMIQSPNSKSDDFEKKNPQNIKLLCVEVFEYIDAWHLYVWNAANDTYRSCGFLS